MKYFFSALVTWLAIYYVLYNQASYTGFYYPYWLENEDSLIVESNIKSLAMCRDWVKDRIHSVKHWEHDDYECWTNCRYDWNLSSRRCSKTYQ